MKKTVLLATTAILGGMMFASQASAATNSDDNRQTNVNASFTAPAGQNLGIEWASDFNFGTHTISSESKTYNSQETLKNGAYVPNYVEVKDQRGVNTGWNLTVKQDGNFIGTNSKQILKGASLTLVQPKVSELSNDDTSTVAVPNNVPVNTAGDSNVMTANKGTMPGYYVGSFVGQNVIKGQTASDPTTDDGVTLNVPANAALVDTYATTLTWSLTAAPDTAN